jgi:hypothetical protein
VVLWSDDLPDEFTDPDEDDDLNNDDDTDTAELVKSWPRTVPFASCISIFTPRIGGAPTWDGLPRLALSLAALQRFRC